MRFVFAAAFLAALAGDPGHRIALAHDIVNRWTGTQFDGGGLQQGDPTTLFWSIVPDGQSYERAGSSNLIGFLDGNWNIATGDRTPNLTNRDWWDVIDSAYQQYGRVSGVTMIYRPEQDDSGQSTQLVGDIRIGGEAFDTNPDVNVLADNTFPNGGDMRIDTTPDGFFNAGNAAGLRNLISHESGHGLGLGHSNIEGADAVMEGGIQSHFFGLQFDDVYAFNRLYGDPREKNGGNDSLATSLSLGTFPTAGAISLGTDAVDSVVEEFDDDWLGIDGTTDEDWFHFNLQHVSVVDLVVTPIGPTYQLSGQSFEASKQANLAMEVYDSNGALLYHLDNGGLGAAEQLMSKSFFETGDYFVRVIGDEDTNQFYQVDLQVDLPELLLTVNRDTGEMHLSGFTSAGADLDGYRIQSPSGSLDPADGAWLSLQDQGIANWREANPSEYSIQELLPSGTIHLTDSDSVYLGNFYSQVLTAPFGTAEEGDITFSYLAPAAGDEWLKGAVKFIGDPFYNNLVLTVDPDTGTAVLVNESNSTIHLDGYMIQSDSGSLDPLGWTSLQDQLVADWRESNPSQTLLTELKPTEFTTLAPGDALTLGQLFHPLGARDLEFSLLLNGEFDFQVGNVVYELIPGPGDYDRDGDVDADDYLVWKMSFGELGHHPADGNLDGVVNLADYTVWRNNLSTSSASGAVGNPSPVPEASTFASALLISLVLGNNMKRKRLTGRLSS